MAAPACANAAHLIAAHLIAAHLIAACLLAAAPSRAAAIAYASKAVPAPEKFDLNEIRIDGSTVLPQEQVEETIYPFLGPGKTPADVEAARRALQDVYNKAGYITVTVGSPRWVDRTGGIVGIHVIERPVERLRVVGARYFVPDAVRAGAPSLKPGIVPNMNQVKYDLVGLNQLPDRTVQPSLKPGRHPDTVDVDLDVTDKMPVHGSLELNNRYNADTHALRLNASLSYNNLFQRGDSATVSYSVAPEAVRDAEVESASYLFHIPDSRMSLLFTYLHSNSNVVALGTTDVAGRGDTAGFRLLIPLGTTSDDAGHTFSHSFSIGWDYKKYFELDTFTTTKTSTTAPVTYYPLNAAYAANWTGPKSITDVNISAELNIAPISSNQPAFDNKRYLANSGFSILRGTFSREQDLPYDVQLWGSLSGQGSNDALVSSEQLGLGGADSIRGYLEAETLGDYGAYLQSELRSPDVKKYIGGPVTTWRFHLFADTGFVGLHDTTTGQRTSYGLSSVGVGTRVNLWGYLNGQVQDAQALNNGPNTRAGTNRVLFRVFGEF
jgi:hemolysin activation/secretion protein